MIKCFYNDFYKLLKFNVFFSFSHCKVVYDQIKFSASYCVSCKSILIPRYTEMRYLLGNTRDMKISWVLMILFDSFSLARVLGTTLYITRQIYYWKKWWVTRRQAIRTLILFCISYRSKTDKPYSNLCFYTQLFDFTYCPFIYEDKHMPWYHRKNKTLKNVSNMVLYCNILGKSHFKIQLTFWMALLVEIQ